MIQNLGERGRMNSPMVSQSTAGRISESTAINENDVRLVYLLWKSSTQCLDQHLAIFSISKREVANSPTMSLTDVAAEKTISTRILAHDVESNCHVREAQRAVFQANASANEECRQSLHQTSRRWYCRCQGVHGLGCPQQLRPSTRSTSRAFNVICGRTCIARLMSRN